MELGGQPLREGEEREGAGQRRVSVWRTKGEGEEVRGRGRGAGVRRHGVAMGCRPAGGGRWP
jgi:hypothetical protein